MEEQKEGVLENLICKRERKNSNSKTLILKDSRDWSIWTYLTASPCYTTNKERERERGTRAHCVFTFLHMHLRTNTAAQATRSLQRRLERTQIPAESFERRCLSAIR